MELDGRVALVTGGATGLGKEIAAALASRGAAVCVGYSRSEAEAQALVSALSKQGARVEVLRANLAQAGAATSLVEGCADRFGRLDVLINNAGTTAWIPWPEIKKVDDATWNQIMAVNLTAPFACARAAADLLATANGAIVNVASLAGVRPRGSSIPYAVSKAGLIHLTLCLATALAPRVRVNAVAPGEIQTDWGQRTGRPDSRGAGERRDAHTPRSVVEAIMLLLESDTLTGQILTLEPGAAGARFAHA